MSFWIGFCKTQDDEELMEEAVGEIVLGDYREIFRSSLCEWSMDVYRDHWKESIQRIVDGDEVSCLITDMHSPSDANFIGWWPMYRQGRIVHFQNHLLFMADLSVPFDIRDPYLSVPRRVQINEEGERISEWSISIDDMVVFFRDLLSKSDRQSSSLAGAREHQVPVAGSRAVGRDGVPRVARKRRT